MKNKSLKKVMFAFAGVGVIAGLLACSGKKAMSNNVQVVQNFDADKYLGTWYEVARFDFKFEKDLKNVTANYSKREDGKIKVLNKGFNTVKNEWEEATGKAKFVGSENEAALKVSFFGPFYSEYNVVQLDPEYKTALIFGESTDYIWILSRSKTISEDTKKKYLDFATKHGYDLFKLVWTIQD
ncbi:lipocalin family protein [Soonwooa sp.]|uniref:lipocalin family protein n=1 Tax=Soonwooa sp. TaxID=1938592 RepID=UPI0028AE4A92|nr:lipocalin family protein [Soonwooa sp.]